MQDSESSSRPIAWRALFQFVFSGFAAFVLWSIALYMLFAGIFPLFQGNLRQIAPEGFILSTSFAWIGMMILPSAWFALLRLLNRPANVPRGLTWGSFFGVILLMLPVTALGYWASITPMIAWLILPVMNVLALSIPALWYLSLGGRGLKSASPQTAWGVFATGLALGPGIILLAELVGGIIAVIVLALWLSPIPGFSTEIQRLALQLQNNPNFDPNALIPFAEKYLMRPSVLISGLLFIAGFVPLLEEFIKPVGMWLMNKKTLTPAQGFLAGMLSGAAFGLFESLLQGVSGEGWIMLALARSGTSLIHIFNSGLVGWGFALAWQQRSPWPWLKRYLLAVLIHGLWNGNTVMIALAYTPEQTLVGPVWGPIGLTVLGILSVGCFLGLLRINRRLQQEVREAEGHAAPTVLPAPEPVRMPTLVPHGAPLPEPNPPFSPAPAAPPTHEPETGSHEDVSGA